MEPLIGFISPTLMWYYELSWPGGRVGSETMGVLVLCGGVGLAAPPAATWLLEQPRRFGDHGDVYHGRYGRAFVMRAHGDLSGGGP
jgi:hypothetical protein